MFGKSEGNIVRLATCPILQMLLERHPSLFNKATSLILTELDCSYDISRSDLPLKLERENAPQKALRESMIEQWAEELDQEFQESGTSFNWSHKKNVLTTLLYSIWNDRNQGQCNLTGVAKQYQSPSTEDPKAQRVLSKAHRFLDNFSTEDETKPSGFHATQRTKSIRSWVARQCLETQNTLTIPRQVDSAHILRFLLRKVQGRHGEKYGQFLADHGLAHVEKWMWESIRPNVLDICKTGRFELDEYVIHIFMRLCEISANRSTIQIPRYRRRHI